MENSARKELIKEYMFLQALEDPYFQKRKTKDRAAQQVYNYLNSEIMSPLQVQTGKKTNPVAYVLESLSHIKDGEFVLSEMQTNFVKDISYGTPITGGVSMQTINKWSSYRESMRNGTLEEDRKKEIADEESARLMQEDLAKKQAAEREAAEKKRREEEAKKKKEEANWKENQQPSAKKGPEKLEDIISGFHSGASFETIKDIQQRLKEREKQIEREKKEALEQEKKRRQEEEREKRIAEREKQRQEKKKLITEQSELACKQRVSDLKLPNDGWLKKEFAQNEADWARNKIAKVDFNLLGKGSPQFDEMMKSLNALKKYAGSKNFDPVKYYDLQKQAIDKTRAYLQYKDDQLKNEPGRKEDPKRQAHEQPRIASAVEVLERLEQSYAEGKKALIDWMQEVAKIRLDEELKKLGRMRAEGDALTQGQFEKSYWQSIHLYDKLKNVHTIASGNPKAGLSLKEYVDDVENNLKAELKQVNARELSNYQKSYITNLKNKGYYNDNTETVLADEDLRQDMDKADQKYRLFGPEKHEEAFDPLDYKVKVHDEAMDYQERMFSNKTKAMEINGIDEHTVDRINSIGSILSHSSF